MFETHKVTNEDLERLAREINNITNAPQEPFIDGFPQARNWHITYGYKNRPELCYMELRNSGIHPVCPLVGSFTTKRKLHDAMRNLILGINLPKDSNTPPALFSMETNL